MKGSRSGGIGGCNFECGTGTGTGTVARSGDRQYVAICAEQVTLNLRLWDPATTTITICQLNGVEGCAVCEKLLFSRYSFVFYFCVHALLFPTRKSQIFSECNDQTTIFSALRWFVYNCLTQLHSTPSRSDPIRSALRNSGSSWLAERDECETISLGHVSCNRVAHGKANTKV